MAETLAIARFALHPLDAPTGETHYRQLASALASVPGFLGQILAVKEDAPSYLAISRYADLAAAERGLVTVAAHPLREKLAVSDGSLADVARYQIRSAAPGAGVFEGRVGGYLSLTVRNAEPGRADELADDLDIIFGELSVIPGFVGHTVGFHETLPEQACALAAWTRKESFARSLPEGRIHDVELYRRVV